MDQTSDGHDCIEREDVRKLTAWLVEQFARGASRIEVRVHRTNTPIESWERTAAFANPIVERARRHLDLSMRLGMIPLATNEPRRSEQLADARKFLVVAFSPTGLMALLELQLSRDDPEFAPSSPDTLQRAVSNLRVPLCAGVRRLLERLVAVLGTSDVDRIVCALTGAKLDGIRELSQLQGDVSNTLVHRCHPRCRDLGNDNS